MSTQPERAASVSLEQLATLNDEIRALVRVGVPLERGLALVGKEMPTATGKLAQWLTEQLQRGQTLQQVLADHPERFPPVYRAVVEAGLRSGRLASALEAVTGSTHRLAQTRSVILASLLYPVLVLLVAWGSFVFYTVKLAGTFLRLVEDFHIPGREFFALWDRWGQSAAYWGPVLPALVIVLLAAWWFASGRASLADPRTAGVLLGWLPGMRAMLRNHQVATFAELLALQVEHGVPIGEALVLAAQATGGSSLVESCRQMASGLAQGQPATKVLTESVGLPPLLVWLISSGLDRGALVPVMRQAADIYRERAQYQAEAARIFVPVFLTVLLGGTVTLLYALVVLGSWFGVLRALA